MIEIGLFECYEDDFLIGWCVLVMGVVCGIGVAIVDVFECEGVDVI